MKQEDEERAIHPLLLAMIERREWSHLNPEQAIVAAEKWFTAGRPWLSNKTKAILEAVAAVEEATKHADGMPGRCLTPEAEKAFNALFEAFLKKE